MVNSYQNWRYHNIIEAIWLAIRGSHPWPIRGHVKIWKIYMSTLQNLYPLNLAGCLLQEGGSARKPLFVSFYWTFPSSLDLKSTLLQISKSASIFVFMWTKICWRFHILTPFLFSHVISHFNTFFVFPREICEKFVYKHSETTEHIKKYVKN